MKKSTVKHHLDGLVALLLFAVFAVCILTVLLTGAGAYQRLTQRDQAAYEERTCLQYIAQRVRQADTLDGIRVEDFHGRSALVLGADEEYVTRVYCHEGYLMELYCAADMELDPEDGERIMEADDLILALDDGLLAVHVDGGPWLHLSLRGGEGDLA